jgi:hypothetical protein
MGLAALWREPFDHLARYAIHDFRSVSRLCGGLYSPLSFDKLVRSYQPPALYTNRKTGVAVGVSPGLGRSVGRYIPQAFGADSLLEGNGFEPSVPGR